MARSKPKYYAPGKWVSNTTDTAWENDLQAWYVLYLTHSAKWKKWNDIKQTMS